MQQQTQQQIQQQMQQRTQQMTQQAQPQFTFEGGHLVMYHNEPTGLPQVKDANVNDRDRMQDLLATEKYLTQAYSIAMNEASHEALYQVMKKNFDALQQAQRLVFNGMFKKGWYKLPVADAQSVTHVHNQFQQYKGQFPFPSQAGQQQQAAAGGTASQQQLNQVVSQAINQAQHGQVPSYQAAATNATATSSMASGPQPDQQLNQKVDQALQEAQRGHVPQGYSAPRRGH